MSAARAQAVDETALTRMVNNLLSKPARHLTVFARLQVSDGSIGIRVELPFDDLDLDTRKRAILSGWKSNDLVVIVIVKGLREYMMCAADGSDGC